jgi:hypothetical protein
LVGSEKDHLLTISDERRRRLRCWLPHHRRVNYLRLLPTHRC